MRDGGIDTFLSGVDRGALMADIGVFAQRTKLSGTAEELESFHYLRQRMDGIGFRTELLQHDALISLPGPARIEVGGDVLACITHSFSRPSAPAGRRGTLVDLGDGEAADFAGRDLRGKILLVNGIASPVAAVRATGAGAAGHIHVSPHEHLHEMCISPVWGSPSAETLDQLPTGVITTVSLDDGTALRRRLDAGEALEVTIHAEVDTGWRKTPILVAELDGPEPDGPFVLFSGHHDTWFQGVMDNGGANATMIEAARLCAGLRNQWRRGLRVCFWSGHSHGRYSGSAWYVDHHWAELDRRCVAHVNLDSTGATGASVLTDSAVSAELGRLAADAVRAETGQQHAGKRHSRAADQSFLGIGIPSMFGSLSHQAKSPAKMRNALGWWWHTKHDNADKIDPENLVRDTRIATRVLGELLTVAVLPIDHAAQMASLLAELGSLDAVLREVMPLNTLTQAAADVAAAAGALHDGAAAESCKAVNQALVRASRALVPLDYTTGDRFAHDPALPLPAWPCLQPLVLLAAAVKAGADQGEVQLLATGAVRARNRLLHGLHEALDALKRT